MLVECCKFGKVIRLVSPEGPLFDPLGCIAVTFERMAAARDCSSSLHGRWFDSRQIETMVFSPPVIAPYTAFSSSSLQGQRQGQIEVADKVENSHHHNVSNGVGRVLADGVSTDNQQLPSSRPSQVAVNNTVDPLNHTTSDSTAEIDLPDVDDFLNSFL
jgi:hypothetical protein